jgi:hypothetical protein
MNTALNSLTKWATKNNMEISASKTALSNKTQWQKIKFTWENNKTKPRNHAAAKFRLNTGHDCLGAWGTPPTHQNHQP